MTSVPDEKHDPSTPVESTTPSTAPSTAPSTTPASKKAPVDPLHGVTLEAMVTDLVAFFGWEELGVRIPVRCFQSDPSVPSSLKFLRKTEWARRRVERLYLDERHTAECDDA